MPKKSNTNNNHNRNVDQVTTIANLCKRISTLFFIGAGVAGAVLVFCLWFSARQFSTDSSNGLHVSFMGCVMGDPILYPDLAFLAFAIVFAIIFRTTYNKAKNRAITSQKVYNLCIVTKILTWLWLLFFLIVSGFLLGSIEICAICICIFILLCLCLKSLSALTRQLVNFCHNKSNPKVFKVCYVILMIEAVAYGLIALWPIGLAMSASAAWGIALIFMLVGFPSIGLAVVAFIFALRIHPGKLKTAKAKKNTSTAVVIAITSVLGVLLILLFWWVGSSVFH